MIESLAFQTRARTIDHLGREQIADCPTAVSELWKNSYDAYARTVALNIYDGKQPIATVVDDGHGMNYREFTERWLVVGTETKTEHTQPPEEDRNGLELRTKQGQKGIGRLSSANLGPLLLVVSKRKFDRFVAALIDWRLFENPYLFLLDIEIPVVEFDEKQELFTLLPEMFDRLMGNIWGSGGKDRVERDQRIERAWERFSEQEKIAQNAETTQSRIEATVIETVFDERHFAQWPLWQGNADHGTILAVSGIQFDLEAQLSIYDVRMDSAVGQARDRLLQTLANFTDPLLDESERQSGYGTADFESSVTVWEGGLQRRIIGGDRIFDLEELLGLEHVVEGEVDAEGVFRGRVKAFGSWLSGEVCIPPAIDIPTHRASFVGPFHLRIGTFEQDRDLTSHPEDQFRRIEALGSMYGGLSVYRNGLRVLPYGREGNDFFEIEKRRTKHAGREFWSLRRLFGRVALRREENPNLRDKAGREGLIDNRAAKSFRDLVENILRYTARKYFGTDSDLRREIIPDRKEESKKRKAEEARSKQRAKNRKNFRNNLEQKSPFVAELSADTDVLLNRLRSTDQLNEADVLEMRTALQDLRRRCQETSLGDVPSNIGAYEERYLQYRADVRRISDSHRAMAESLNEALDKLNPRSPRDIAYSELNANAAFLHKHLRSWSSEAKSLLSSELERITELQDERNKAYHAKMLPLLDEISSGSVSLRQASEQLEQERNRQDSENAELFEPYISALSSLKERIDLAGLAHFSLEQAEELREEVDRLHGLAQLGITVEIIGHEIESLEQTISEGLKAFPNGVKQTDEYSNVLSSHESLVDRLRFLSPLKISGPKTRTNLTGKHIYEYVKKFFGENLAQADINLEATPAFLAFSIFEQPARIYPVFLNLVNNAAYWVNHASSLEKRILLDAVDGKVVVADTGPGVDEEDRKQLFRLFFTRKSRGGRGVGLYLCRANLAAGGHSIEYANNSSGPLTGANFVIDFKGAKYE